MLGKKYRELNFSVSEEEQPICNVLTRFIEELDNGNNDRRTNQRIFKKAIRKLGGFEKPLPKLNEVSFWQKIINLFK